MRGRVMLDAEVITEVLFKMTGEISPIQETNYDNEAYENQKKMMFVIDECIEKIIKNAEREDTYAYSVGKIKDNALDYLSSLVEYIRDRLDC
jgi:hypothetical protein